MNVAPAIVSLQRQAEDLRQAELHRMQSRLGILTAEQRVVVEALTRGLVNKLLHPPMQALKQAARENDSARVDALCDAWSLPSVADRPAEVMEISATRTEESADIQREEKTAAAGRS